MEKELKNFRYLFQISKSILVGVDYYKEKNKKIYVLSVHNFTEGNFVNKASDYKKFLEEGIPARKFFDKWYTLQGKELTEEQYQEIKKDIKELKEAYNYLENLNCCINPPFSLNEMYHLKNLKSYRTKIFMDFGDLVRYLDDYFLAKGEPLTIEEQDKLFCSYKTVPEGSEYIIEASIRNTLIYFLRSEDWLLEIEE